MNDLIVSIVVPCYNEEAALPATALALSEKLKALAADNLISEKSFILFVDDGSQDATWHHIERLNAKNSALFCGLKLSKNRGHQNALLAGLHTINNLPPPPVKCVISIDADLQDDVDAIDEMLKKHREEQCEIVYGVRSSRKTDSIFKRITAQAFYKLLKFLGVEIIYNHADFRLMSSDALRSLCEYNEVNLFLRGLIPMLGYKTGIVYYARKERLVGESKYPLGKMLKFAFEGVTSLSIKPIRFIAALGAVIFMMSIVMIIYFFVRHYTGYTIIGWSSLIVSLWAIGGLILFSLGIVGEYIGKIYLETKSRPRWSIEKKLIGYKNVE